MVAKLFQMEGLCEFSVHNLLVNVVVNQSWLGVGGHGSIGEEDVFLEEYPTDGAMSMTK